MPFVSQKQRAYIYAAAARGEKWAIKFIKDSRRLRHTKKKLRGE